MDNLPRPSDRELKNTVAIPRQLMEWLLTLPPNECKVGIIIALQTYGWHKDRDQISYSQFLKKAGCGREALAKALQELRSSGYLQVTDEQGDKVQSKEDSRGKKLFYSFVYAQNYNQNKTFIWPEPDTTTSPKTELVSIELPSSITEQVPASQTFYQSVKRSSETEHTKDNNTKLPLQSNGSPKNNWGEKLKQRFEQIITQKPSQNIQNKFQHYALEAVKIAGLKGAFAGRIFRLYKQKDYGEFQVRITRDVVSGNLYQTLNEESKVRYLIGAYKKSI